MDTMATVTPIPAPTVDLSAFASQVIPLGGLVTIPENWVDPILEQEEREKAERREEHISYCGTQHWTIEPVKRTRYPYEISCKYWRHCPRCYRDRVAWFAGRAERGQEEAGSHYRVAVVDSNTARIMVRKIHNKDDYFRTPREDEDLVVEFNAFGHEDVEEMVKDYLIDPLTLDWSVLARTPESTRFTGYLGRDREEEETEEYISIKVPQFAVSKITPPQLTAAWEETVLETAHLDPLYDVEDMELTCWIVIKTWKEEIVRLGGVIAHETSRYTRVFKRVYEERESPRCVTTEKEGEKQAVPGEFSGVCPF